MLRTNLELLAAIDIAAAGMRARKVSLKGQTATADATDMIGTSYQVDLLSQMMRMAELRHRVASENIANVNTPGYRAREVSFDEALRELSSGSASPGHAQPQIVESTRQPVRSDGNTVNVDHEMSTLTNNAIQFEAFAQLLASKMGMLRTAISRR